MPRKAFPLLFYIYLGKQCYDPSLCGYPADLIHCPAAVTLGRTFVGEGIANGKAHLAVVENIVVICPCVAIHRRISCHVLVEQVVNRQRGTQLVLDDIPVHAHREAGPVAPVHPSSLVREHGPIAKGCVQPVFLVQLYQRVAA